MSLLTEKLKRLASKGIFIGDPKAMVEVKSDDYEAAHDMADESLVPGLVEQPEAPDYQDLQPITPDPIVNTVIDKMTQRSVEGIKKYGHTMERTDITLVGWIDHTIEELLDAAIYLERMRVDVVKLDDLITNAKVLQDVTDFVGHLDGQVEDVRS